MTIERQLWAPPFRSLPRWPCPRCGSGQLLPRKGSPHLEETGWSKAEHNHEDWDPDWITERFYALLDCSVPDCGELVVVSGTSGETYYTDVDVDGQLYQAIENSLNPISVFPAPYLFPLSTKCPESVREHLKSAFGLIWTDYASCANKLRSSVEALLTERKIATYSKLVKGKPRQPLSLHKRIEIYRAKNKEAAECLEAVKWLGNHGSHGATSLRLEDVLIAADILEYVIALIYDPKPSPPSTAKKINKKKGPV